MYAIRYKAVISYSDLYTDELKQKVYHLFAKDENDAKNIVGEIFLTQVGVVPDMHLELKPVKPNEAVEDAVTKQYISIVRELNRVFSNCNYHDFIQNFLTFEGKGFEMDGKRCSYFIDFMGLTVKVMSVNGLVSILADEVKYFSEANGCHYVIRKGSVYFGN